jgi:hypothetical protein
MKFFNHEIGSRKDDQIFELIDIHGLAGYGFFWVILEELYGSEDTGFQIEATNVWMKRLARSLNLTDDRTLVRYFDTLADLGLINKQLWQEHIIYSSGVMERADAYMQRKAKEAEKKRNQRAQALLNLECPNPVPRDTSGTNTMSLNVPIADPDPDPNSDPNSFFLRVQEKKINAPCKIEISLPEEKKEDLALENKSEDQDPTPPVASPPPTPIAQKFIDPYQRAMDVRKREPEVKKMMDDREFLKFLIPLMKRWDAYKTSCDSSDARKWVRVAIEPKNDKCDSRWDESRDRYQDFLESQAKKQQQAAPQPQQITVASPVPNSVKDFTASLAARLARKTS